MKKLQFALFGAVFAFFVVSGFAMEFDTSDWDKTPSPTNIEVLVEKLCTERLAFVSRIIKDINCSEKCVLESFLKDNEKVADVDPYKAMCLLIDCWLYFQDKKFEVDEESGAIKKISINDKLVDLVCSKIEGLLTKIAEAGDKQPSDPKYFWVGLEIFLSIRIMCQENLNNVDFISKFGSLFSNDVKKFFMCLKEDCDRYKKPMKRQISEKVLLMIKKRKRSKSSPPTKKTENPFDGLF
jgi:hypothetical protein